MRKKKQKNSLFTHIDNNSEIRITLYILLMVLKYYKPKPRPKNKYFKTLKKENRAKDNKVLKNDYIHNYEFYKYICIYQYLSKKLKILQNTNYDYLRPYLKKQSNEIAKRFKNDIYNNITSISINDNMNQDIGHILSTIEELEYIMDICKYSKIIDYRKKIDKYENMIIKELYKMTKKIVNMHNFRGYPYAEKEDMCGFAMEKILKTKPWRSFNVDKTNAAFSFMTKVIFNYYLQHRKKYYKYENEKQVVLRRIMNEFDAEWCTKGINFNLSEGIDFDD